MKITKTSKLYATTKPIKATTVYLDDTGLFGGHDAMTSKELEDYYAENKHSDPVLAEYPDFESWYSATTSNMTDITNDLDEIAERYNSSSPLSGYYEKETEHEMQAIAREFGISEENARQLMEDYLGFEPEDFNL